MRKNIYQKPRIDVVELQYRHQILTVSNGDVIPPGGKNDTPGARSYSGWDDDSDHDPDDDSDD